MSAIGQGNVRKMHSTFQLGARLWRRAPCDQDGCEEMPVSTWQKTGIPVIIGVVLFFIAFVVLFFIVRRRRQITKRAEEEAQAKIDLDDVEERAEFRAGRKH